jgi:rubrerythrin
MVMGMVVDVGVVKNHIKPKTDSTLYNMRKVDMIEYIRTLEHNYNVAVSFNENQAKYIESLDVAEVVHGRWIVENEESIRCSECCFNRATIKMPMDYCPNCGAKMDGDMK